MGKLVKNMNGIACRTQAGDVSKNRRNISSGRSAEKPFHMGKRHILGDGATAEKSREKAMAGRLN